MDFSQFGKRMTCDAGILSLMDDLGKVKATGGKDILMMGGGNPGLVPEFQELMRNELLEICTSRQSFQQMVGSYAPPQGETFFVEKLAELLRDEQGWDVGPENICLTNGSQTAFFMLFNLFAGTLPDGTTKRICLPMAPEYIGYADLGLDDNLFVSTRPRMEILEDDFYKYHIDFDTLEVGDDIGAICISRPTNPTGNVVTDEEIERLMAMAAKRDIPLILDNAYGLPFPGMMYVDVKPVWNEDIVCCLSLSKLGLPAVRTGIVIARKEVARALASMNAIMSLSPNNFGAVMAQQIVASREITKISRELIQPFYEKKMEKAVATVREEFAGIPCSIHKPEGAMFLWLWFKDLPITSLELYEQLKEHGVLVVSGHYFFPGLAGDWQHKDECLRVTYSQDDEDVRRGLAIIARVVRRAYEMSV